MNLYEFRVQREEGKEIITTSMFVVAPSMLHVIKSNMIELQDMAHEVVEIKKHVPVCQIIENESEDDLGPLVPPFTVTRVEIEDDLRFGEAMEALDGRREPDGYNGEDD